jgi:hypothetical protein
MQLLRKLKSEDEPANRTCERCGKEFHCGASLLGCWCMEIKLNDDARAYMRGKFKSCLCRECLQHFAGPKETWTTQA